MDEEQQQQQQQQNHQQQQQEHQRQRHLPTSWGGHVVPVGSSILPFLRVCTTLACSHDPCKEAALISSAVFPNMLWWMPAKPLLGPVHVAITAAFTATLREGSPNIVLHLLQVWLSPD
jgi:hypothetical protein